MADQPDVNVKLDTYVKLYERQMAHYENTQGIEWKVSLGVWALLAAAITLTAQNRPALLEVMEPWLARVVVMLAVLMFPFAHWSWLRWVHESEDFDKKLWTRYRASARAILLSPGTIPSDEEEVGRREPQDERAWLAVETGITVALALVLLCVLWPA